MNLSDLLLLSTTMTADKRQMRDRILRIAKPRKPAAAALFAALALTGVVCAVTFTGAAAREAEPPITDETPRAATPEAVPQTPDAEKPEDDVPAEVKQFMLDYLRARQEAYADTYFAADTPAEPRSRDERIDSVSYLGETALDETEGVAYQYTFSRNYAADGWYAYSPFYLVLSRGRDGNWQGVLSDRPRQVVEGKRAEDLILEAAWGVDDVEFSLSRDGYPMLVGLLGGGIPFFRDAYDGGETVEVLREEAERLDGAYMAWHRRDGFAALCDHYNGDGDYLIERIETTRADLATHRGVRVGDSREAVRAAYPTLYDTSYRGLYDGEDVLWYCGSDTGWGSALLFFFDGDAVSRIVLNQQVD